MHGLDRGAMRAFLAAALLLVPTAPATAAPGLLFGISDVRFANESERTFALAAPLSLDRVAVNVRWTPGRTDTSELAAIPLGQPVTLVVDGWAWDSPRGGAGAWARADYARFTRALVDRYPNITEVQVWNEPWPPTFYFWLGSIYEYLELVAATYDALPRRVKLLAPGSHPNLGSQRTFVRAVRQYYRLTERSQRLFDGYSVHPYWNWEKTKLIARMMDRLWRGLPQQSPRRGLRFYWTETGMESASVRGDKWRLAGDETKQAIRVGALVRRADREPLVVAYYNFLLIDEPRTDGWKSGLITADGRVKPAYHAFARAIAEVRASR